MKEKKSLSFSGWQKFMLCPKYYDIYYNERLEPKKTTSALMFGTAIDTALNDLLLLKKSNPVKIFQDNFNEDIIRETVFDKKDYDLSVFSQDDIDRLKGKSEDYVCWASLRVKGRILIEHYIKIIFPLIKKVHSVQKELNKRSGFIDLVADVTFYDGSRVLIDHKTSYWPYNEDSTKNSAQLNLYAGDQEIGRICYVVLQKRIRTKKRKVCSSCGHSVDGGGFRTCNAVVEGKRCDGAWEFTVEFSPEIQIIDSDTNKELVGDINQSLKSTENVIKMHEISGVFPKNLSTCDFVYGKRCQYFEYCRNGNKEGLKIREKK